MKMELKKILDSSYATNPAQGKLVFGRLSEFAKNSEHLEISFDGIDLLSSAFLNESIGKFFMLFPEKSSHTSFDYPIDRPLFRAKINDVLENIGMGDEYDQWVENAQAH